MSDFKLPQVPGCLPLYGIPWQHGITDPIWPVDTPKKLKLEHAADYLRYRGRVDLQGFLTLIRANVHAKTRDELKAAAPGPVSDGLPGDGPVARPEPHAAA